MDSCNTSSSSYADLILAAVLVMLLVLAVDALEVALLVVTVGMLEVLL
jgi:hypothetical protein